MIKQKPESYTAESNDLNLILIDYANKLSEKFHDNKTQAMCAVFPTRPTRFLYEFQWIARLNPGLKFDFIHKLVPFIAFSEHLAKHDHITLNTKHGLSFLGLWVVRFRLFCCEVFKIIMYLAIVFCLAFDVFSIFLLFSKEKAWDISLIAFIVTFGLILSSTIISKLLERLTVPKCFKDTFIKPFNLESIKRIHIDNEINNRLKISKNQNK